MVVRPIDFLLVAWAVAAFGMLWASLWGMYSVHKLMRYLREHYPEQWLDIVMVRGFETSGNPIKIFKLAFSRHPLRNRQLEELRLRVRSAFVYFLSSVFGSVTWILMWFILAVQRVGS